MDRAFIPEDIRRFILVCIPSVPYLEAMLLLRANPHQSWQCHNLAARLYVSDNTAASLLAQLHETGILDIDDVNTPSYCYRPSSEDLQQIIDRLAKIYSRNLLGVTNLIHSKTDKKAQKFAEAFVWRKDT